MYILGISAFYHDSAAALIKDGKIIAAISEERLTRKKGDSSFPVNSIKFCLEFEGILLKDISYIAFYDKPFLKFERILQTALESVPRGIWFFAKVMPVWIKEKLFTKRTLIRGLYNIDRSIAKKEWGGGKILFAEHHQSHAASSFFASSFEESAILTMDGVGEWVTAAIGYGKNNDLSFSHEIMFPHSLGLLYSAVTYYLGFKVNSGEYKVMGLAPYGNHENALKYVNIFKNNIIDIKDDGSFALNMQYFTYTYSFKMIGSRFERLFNASARKPESNVEQFHMDIALALQMITEEVVLKLAKTAHNVTGSRKLCLAGGVALNCVANGKIVKEYIENPDNQKNIFDEIYIQPAAGDSGGAIGCALSAYYQYLNNSRNAKEAAENQMQDAYLGPSYGNEYIRKMLDTQGVKFHLMKDNELIKSLTDNLVNGKIVALHRGRMEFGPRALGNRSIIGDARNDEMQTTMNLKIKYRESFRPFAPIVLEEDLCKYFNMRHKSPYMLIVTDVQDSIKIPETRDDTKLFGIERLKRKRSILPAITHVDYSARIQTVSQKHNNFLYNLLLDFKQRTGTSVLVNTSFNVRGEPIVCTPEDSLRCFSRTEIDILVLENYIILKSENSLKSDESWKKEFEMD